MISGEFRKDRSFSEIPYLGNSGQSYQFYTHNLETFFGENPQPISLFINYSFIGQNFILSWKVILINKMRVSLTSQVHVAHPYLEK